MVLFILFPIRFPIIYVIVVKILVKTNTSITFVIMLSFMNNPFVRLIAGKCDKYIGKLILPKKYINLLLNIFVSNPLLLNAIVVNANIKATIIASVFLDNEVII